MDKIGVGVNLVGAAVERKVSATQVVAEVGYRLGEGVRGEATQPHASGSVDPGELGKIAGVRNVTENYCLKMIGMYIRPPRILVVTGGPVALTPSAEVTPYLTFTISLPPPTVTRKENFRVSSVPRIRVFQRT